MNMKKEGWFCKVSFLSSLCFVLVLLLSVGTSQAAKGSPPKEITVSAASSLTNAVTELKKLFEAENPGVTVLTNFASSNPLLKQIQEGAPVDVFASADQQTMDKAVASNNIVAGTRKNFALNGLVLIVPIDSKNIPASPQDLLDEAYSRIAIGNIQSVPAGRYAEAALVSDKLWKPLAARYIFGENVRQVLDYVARAEVDAGFVYTTDAYIAKDKVRIALTMDGHNPVSYPIAIVEGTKNKELAQKFIDFVLSDAGSAVLTKYGFAKP